MHSKIILCKSLLPRIHRITVSTFIPMFNLVLSMVLLKVLCTCCTFCTQHGKSTIAAARNNILLSQNLGSYAPRHHPSHAHKTRSVAWPRAHDQLSYGRALCETRELGKGIHTCSTALLVTRHCISVGTPRVHTKHL